MVNTDSSGPTSPPKGCQVEHADIRLKAEPMLRNLQESRNFLRHQLQSTPAEERTRPVLLIGIRRPATRLGDQERHKRQGWAV